MILNTWSITNLNVFFFHLVAPSCSVKTLPLLPVASAWLKISRPEYYGPEKNLGGGGGEAIGHCF